MAKRASSRRAVVLVAGTAIVLVALNLRPAVTSFGALLREVQEATGMSSTVAGVLTTLPPICFGAFGLVGGWFGRRLGTGPALLAAMALTAGGLAARVATDRPWVIVLFTVPALAGMAIGNVLLPVAVKRAFPRHVGRATGLYSMALALGTALAAALSVPIAQGLGTWRAGLGVWAVTPLLAVVPLLAIRRLAARAGAGADAVPRAVPPFLAYRHPTAWALAGFFGLQSLAAYVVMGWLPTIYRDAGVAPTTAGLLLALVMLLGAPISLALPELAARRDDQRSLVVGLAACAAGAYIGLLVAPAAAPVLWALLLGVGMGAFPLALVLIGLRSGTSDTTARLSAFSQGTGYLIAASGPLAMGALHDATGSWTPPLLVLIALLAPQLWCGLIAAKPGSVDGGRSIRHDT
jgi:MFS transporter, CP family, cyanate transporter